jgi:hypothetical protein
VTPLLLSGTILTAQQRNSPLTNNDVVKMVKSGLPEATIVNTIATSDTQFDLSSAGLQALSQSGVSSNVVRAMLAAESKKKDAAPPVADNTATPDTSPDTSSGANGQAAGHDSDDGTTALRPRGRKWKQPWPEENLNGLATEVLRRDRQSPLRHAQVYGYHSTVRSIRPSRS